MNNKTSLLRGMAALSLVAGLLSPGFVGSAQAVLRTWTGGGAPNANWQTAANWSGGSPSANDILNFANSTQLANTNDFPSGTLFNNIVFDGTAGAFTLFGNDLRLVVFTNGTEFAVTVPTGGSISNFSGSAETMALPISLSPGRHTFATVGGGQLNINGAVTRSPGAVAVFAPSSGAINVTGALVTNNNILGGWATIGNDWATLDANSNVVAYTSYTDINGGMITSDPSANLRYTSDSANITNVAGGQLNSILTIQSGGRSIINLGVLKLGANGGVYRVGSGTTTINGGPVVAGGGGEITLYDSPFNAGSGNNLTMISVISNDTPNVVSVTVEGYVAFSQTAPNTYSGGTFINQGRVQAGRVDTFGTGPVYVYPGGQAFLNADGTYTNDFFIGGIGTPENNGLGAFRINKAARIVSGRVTLMGDATIGGVGRISGPITGPGALSVGRGNSGNGHGTYQLGGAVPNDYNGDTTINGSASQAADTIQINTGANSIMPHGAGKGNLVLNAGSATATATFDLNGTTQTVNALTNTATSPANDTVTTAVSGGVLILGDNDASSTFSGKIINALSIVKIGAGTQTLSGPNTYANGTTVRGGKLIIGSGSLPVATPALTVNNNGILDISAVTPLTLPTSSTLTMSNGTVSLTLQSTASSVTVSNLVVDGATNKISVDSVDTLSAYPTRVVAIKYTTLTGTPNFGIGTLPASPGTPYAAFVSNNVGNSSIDVVFTGGPSSLKWSGFSGGSPNSTWDIGGAANWKTLAGVATTYADGIFAVFDNSASNGIVSVSQDVAPAGITVSNSVLSYLINGGSKITGSASLSKSGSGLLILANSSANDFAGDVSVFGGTLQIGNDDGGGNIPATASVLNNGTLVFAHTDLAVSNLVSGTGGVVQRGGSTLTLGGINTFTGAVVVTNNSTLKAGSASALGATNVGTIVYGGSTLDVNGFNLGAEPVTVSGAGVGGAGAINNSGADVFPSLAFVTLAGDTTFGASLGRWDLRSPGGTTGSPATAALSTGGNPYSLIKKGAAIASIVSATVDPMLANIDIQEGTLNVEGNVTSLGNPTNVLSVANGATLQIHAATNRLNKVFVVNDGATVTTTSGSNVIVGPMNITNSQGGLFVNFSIAGTSSSLDLNGPLTGDGYLFKTTGTNQLIISGNSPDFAGYLVIAVGTASLSGTLGGQGVVLQGGGRFNLNGNLVGGGVMSSSATTIITGSGTAVGALDIPSKLFPGDLGIPGTLTAGGLVLQNPSIVTFDLGSTNTIGGGVNDLVAVNGNLTVNGNTININVLPGLLQTGPSHPYTLFTYSGSLTWNSDLSVPDQLGYHFTVNTNVPGRINVIVSGGPAVWNGGSATDNNWSDSANWNNIAIVPNSILFFGSTNRLNNTNDQAADISYAGISFNTDAGPFVLNGSSVVLNGNVVNASSTNQTINLGLEVSGSNVTLNGSSSRLTIGAGVTNISGAIRTITLAGTGTMTNLLGSVGTSTNILGLVDAAANWTITDNPSSVTVTNPVQLDVQSGTLNFGSESSAPNLVANSLLNSRLGVLPGTPGTLNMVSGTLTVGARFNTGGGGNAIANLNVSGGTLNVSDLLQCSDSAATALTTINLTGGAINVGLAGANNMFLASRGTGIVNVANSAILSCATMDLSRNAAGNSQGSVGVVNLDGGTLAVTRIGTATGSAQTGPPTTGLNPSANFNFNGGTLLAKASSTTFFLGSAASPAIPIISTVKAGGAIVDSGAFNITIAEPLQHDATLGSTNDGGLVKKGAGTLTLTAAGTYTGDTVISNGTLAVNGSIGRTIVTVAAGTLAGNGSIGSNVTVSVNGNISPAGDATLGTLTIAGNLTLQGNTVANVNATTATNDLLKATNIVYGGTLSVTNLAGTLTSSSTFKLFSAVSYSGTFSSVVPTVPAPGLAWNTNTLNTDGILRLTATINTQPTNITATLNGNVLTLAWPADHTGWRLEVQTNSLNVGLNTNWVTWPGADQVNSTNITINLLNGTVFYRLAYP